MTLGRGCASTWMHVTDRGMLSCMTRLLNAHNTPGCVRVLPSAHAIVRIDYHTWLRETSKHYQYCSSSCPWSSSMCTGDVGRHRSPLEDIVLTTNDTVSVYRPHINFTNCIVEMISMSMWRPLREMCGTSAIYNSKTIDHWRYAIHAIHRSRCVLVAARPNRAIMTNAQTKSAFRKILHGLRVKCH